MKLALSLNRAGLIALAILSVSVAVAQVSQGVTLKSHIGLATFGASSGNDCWGYVSPSGREYAIMGLNNMVAYIEVTDPSNPVILKTIPHSSSTWGDIKVYNGFAYSVTETAGTGIQVVDMTDIDNGIVTLVKTLTFPSRAHNVALDTQNGFLYTCGTRGGSGTTMCFSLANPANPVQVGPASMTTDYHHDGQLVNYTSGPMAGKQIWYGFSEGRGVDVYDFTNKNAPIMIKRIIYPNMNYCHQGWISEDGQYLYVDDELDEGGLNVNTRSLIFNVSDPINAFFVGTFSTNLPAIDHNQYIDDGFSFQSNYRSGLRIFDTASTPEAPLEVGFYDTYPADDARAFDGSWSNYAFFPSGNVIISDINSGFYVVDPSAAVTRKKAPIGFTTTFGSLMNGNLAGLSAVDGNFVQFGPGTVPPTDGYSSAMESWVTSFDSHPDTIKVTVVSRAVNAGCQQSLEIYDWAHSSWVQLNFSSTTTSFGSISGLITTNTSDFVQPLTNVVKARVRWQPFSRTGARLVAQIDQIKFELKR
ncbi:MAG: choice-of-anchor B family protein [Fimbriimonadaceae bacterium]